MKYDNEMRWPEGYIDNARNMALDAAEKAAAEKQREVAKKMKDKGLDAETIADCTGLTAKEIEAL